MIVLLDTNVVSELRKSERLADPAVRSWARSQRTSELWLSVITVMEIEIGITRLKGRDSTSGKKLRAWLENDVLEGFSGRILPVDMSVARRAAAMHVPDPRPERDTLIAATALERNFVVATRNVADFSIMGGDIVNPWSAS